MQQIIIGLIKIYQYITPPFIRARCRYCPSCSEYAIQAIERFGILKGIILAVRRIGRCHPWGGYGYDPVPDKEEQK
jgi:putative membrane protein insertion efficiency factor